MSWLLLIAAAYAGDVHPWTPGASASAGGVGGVVAEGLAVGVRGGGTVSALGWGHVDASVMGQVPFGEGRPGVVATWNAELGLAPSFGRSSIGIAMALGVVTPPSQQDCTVYGCDYPSASGGFGVVGRHEQGGGAVELFVGGGLASEFDSMMLVPRLRLEVTRPQGLHAAVLVTGRYDVAMELGFGRATHRSP